MSYILGFIVCWFLITYQDQASFCLQRLASFCRGHIATIKDLRGCGICSNASCKRHPTVPNATPWKNLYIDKRLNDSIEQVRMAIKDEANKTLIIFYFTWHMRILPQGRMYLHTSHEEICWRKGQSLLHFILVMVLIHKMSLLPQNYNRVAPTSI